MLLFDLKHLRDRSKNQPRELIFSQNGFFPPIFSFYNVYSYYLTKHEQLIGTDILNQETVPTASKPTTKAKVYEERDLHKLLSSYLKSTDIYSKTIFHETSNGKDRNQIWTHPDMVGIKFLNLQTKVSQNFLKSINRVDTFKLSS